MSLKFYKCQKCGQVVVKLTSKGIPLSCCGEVMQELLPQENETLLQEKHVPKSFVYQDTVYIKVGEILHPMTNEHYIEWILLHTSEGIKTKRLQPGDVPEALFHLNDGEELYAVYAYCNIHSLWKKCLLKDGCCSSSDGCHIKGM